jgi:hypothetical protein
MNRRTVRAGAGTIGLASLSGCLGAAGFDEYASDPATIESSVLDETGYERVEADEIVSEEELSYLLFDETIEVRSHLTEYEKAIDMGPLGTRQTAGFLLLTSPQISAAGREFNPVEGMDAEELIGLVDDNYDGVSNLTRDRDETVTVLDQETTRSTFAGDGEFSGFEIPVTLLATEPVEIDDDFLATVAIYPEHASGEVEHVVSLTDAVR